MNTFARIVIFALLLIVFFIGFGLYVTIYKTLPNHSAIISAKQLNSSVDVHWDPYGTPYIYAQTEADLYFTTGYIHAQERLWQMTLSQIAAEGRFSEFLGEELIPLDIHQRTIGFWHTAGLIEDETPPFLLDLLQAYSDGVNHFVEQNKRSLPVEFALLGVKPIPWTPRHTIALTRLMAWDQNNHWWSKLSFALLAERVSPAHLQQFIPVYEDTHPTTLDEAASSAFAEHLLPFFESEMKLRSMLNRRGWPTGSNAWAVKGSKTETGFPILAGDPHMGLSIPGFWFELSLSTPDHQITGATIPGSPFIILGQDQQKAWSMTNIMADDTDFFIEMIPVEIPDHYLVDTLGLSSSLLPFEERLEVIRVLGADDRLHKVRSTRNGPVVSEVHPAAELFGEKTVTLRWTGHRISHELLALYEMNRATSIYDFREAVTHFHTPGMNFIYADRDDNIAIFTGARLPVRDGNPLLLREGWIPERGWSGDIPFNELPHVVNPDRGFVAHANNKLHTESYPHYISFFWEPHYRISRIEDLLRGSDSLSVADMQALQNDITSLHAAEIVERILPVLRSSSSDLVQRALPYLENWDYRYDRSSTAASIFDLFFLNYARNLLENAFGEELYDLLIELEHLPVVIASRFLTSGSTIFFSPAEAETVEESMISALEEFNSLFGSEPITWRWENLHTLTLRPPLLGEAVRNPDSPALLRLIVNQLLSRGPYPSPGNSMTVNKAQYSWHRPFETELGPSIRRIVDFSDPGRSLSVLPAGQSGNPFSANYSDQTEMWLEGRYRFLYSDSTFFRQTTYTTMTFQP